jgi:ketosteroid isomerase-like protein
MSQEDVEIVLDQFAATNERDFARAMRHYADDVELVVPPNSSLEVGAFKGREAVGRWFGDWFRHFRPGYEFEIEEARDLGHAVLIVASHRGYGRTSGAEVHGRTAYLYTLRNGKIARVEFDVDRSKALEAAGLRE